MPIAASSRSACATPRASPPTPGSPATRSSTAATRCSQQPGVARWASRAVAMRSGPAPPSPSACRPPTSATTCSTARPRTSSPTRGGSIAPAAEPSNDAEWTVRRVRRRVHARQRHAGSCSVDGTGALVAVAPARARRRFDFAEATGCATVPRGRRQRHGRAGHRQPALRRGLGPGRGAHAPHGVRVPRRQGALRPAVAQVRRALTRCVTAPTTRSATDARRSSRTSSSAIPPAATTRSAGRPSPTGRIRESLTHEQSYYRWLERA